MSQKQSLGEFIGNIHLEGLNNMLRLYSTEAGLLTPDKWFDSWAEFTGMIFSDDVIAAARASQAFPESKNKDIAGFVEALLTIYYDNSIFLSQKLKELYNCGNSLKCFFEAMQLSYFCYSHKVSIADLILHLPDVLKYVLDNKQFVLDHIDSWESSHYKEHSVWLSGNKDYCLSPNEIFAELEYLLNHMIVCQHEHNTSIGLHLYPLYVESGRLK